MNIGIIGASGFIGKNLINYFKNNKTHHNFVSMSRNYQLGQNWRMIDLFSKSITEEALQNIDVAVYLVHSMLPSSKLTQGTFFDIDLLLADNFVQACLKNNVKKIIYISGIIPEDSSNLSTHLKSRKEVEDLFMNSKIETSVIRTGLIIGDKGSSLNILKRIIEKSPILLIPQELHNKTQVVSSERVIEEVVNQCRIDYKNQIINLGYEPISYFELMKLMMIKTNKFPILINIKYYPIKLLSFLASLISSAPYNLIRPLFESLKHNMISDSLIQGKTHEEINKLSSNGSVPNAFKPSLDIKKVRSVQRINLNKELSVPIYKVYYRWLRENSIFIGVDEDKDVLTFYFIHKKIKLLQLEYAKDHSSEKRQLLFIKGGLLASKDQDYGRMEFRIINKKIIICAIHDYIPSIPWWLYIITQAQIHRLVMNGFKKFLEKI